MCPNPQEIANLVAFTEEILNGNIHFLCSGYCYTKMEIPAEDLMNCHYTTKP